MGFFDLSAASPRQPAPLTDEQALARYRYMLATAPPEDIERAHEEAFARLTPEQRAQALQALAQDVPAERDPGRRSGRPRPGPRPGPSSASRARSSGRGARRAAGRAAGS